MSAQVYRLQSSTSRSTLAPGGRHGCWLVTDADEAAEREITARLRKTNPSALIVGEEAAGREPDLLARVATADLDMGALSHAPNTAVNKWGWTDKSPMVGVKKPKIMIALPRDAFTPVRETTHDDPPAIDLTILGQPT